MHWKQLIPEYGFRVESQCGHYPPPSSVLSSSEAVITFLIISHCVERKRKGRGEVVREGGRIQRIEQVPQKMKVLQWRRVMPCE